MRRWRLLVVVFLVAVGVGVVYGVRERRRPLPAPPKPEFTFDGKSSELKHTQIVATLDAPIEKGKNVIWCASFQAAWKELQTMAGGPVQLEGGGPVVDALNRAHAPGVEIPAGAMYATAGWEDKGILQQIRADVARQFPGSATPTFPGIIPGSFVAYSRLEATAKFGIPYFQSRKRLEFTAGDGTKMGVSSFGIRVEDDYAYEELRRQPRVLFDNAEEEMFRRHQAERAGDTPPADSEEYRHGMKATRCIVDLDQTSAPSQVFLAMVERKGTLAETLAAVENQIAAQNARPGLAGIGPNDVLLVPDVVWRVTHRFADLERRVFAHPSLKGQSLDVAEEDLLFRLDRSGAELRAESKTYMLPIPQYYVFDHPFLIIMRKRGETRPYFVMWVENAELLKPM